jgi:hypothetical protein
MTGLILMIFTIHTLMIDVLAHIFAQNSINGNFIGKKTLATSYLLTTNQEI